MKRSKYYIRVMRPVFQRAILTVEATSDEAALHSALEQAEQRRPACLRPVASRPRRRRGHFQRTHLAKTSIRADGSRHHPGLDHGLMIGIVNKTYTFLRYLEELAGESAQTRRWNRPKLDRDLMIGVRYRRAARRGATP